MSDFYHQVRDLMFANAEHCPVSNILDTLEEICADKAAHYQMDSPIRNKWIGVLEVLGEATAKIRGIELRGRK